MTVFPAAGVQFNLDPTENKPLTFLTIKNVSDSPISYKVKTTMPPNYLVRPNQGVIKAQSDITVKIIFNFPLDSPVNPYQNNFLLVRRKSY